MSKNKGKAKSSSLLFFWLAPLVVLLGTLLLQRLPLVEQLENVTVDWRFKQRAVDDLPFDPRLLVVGVDNDSVDEKGRWPWPRKVLGDFLETLKISQKPAVVAFDLFFPDEDTWIPGSDDEFLDELVGYRSAITGAVSDTPANAAAFSGGPIGKTKPLTQVEGDISRLLGDKAAMVPFEEMANTTFTGFVNCEPAADGAWRKMPMVVRSGDSVYPSFSLLAVMRLEGALKPDDVSVELGREVRLKGSERELVIPIDEHGQLALNYRRKKPDMYSMLAIWNMAEAEIDAGKAGKASDWAWPEGVPTVKDKLLVVGLAATGLPDLGETPVNTKAPGVLVQALAMDNILTGDFLIVVDSGWVWVAWLLLTCATLWLLRKTAVWLAVAVPLALALLYGLGAFQLFNSHSLQLPLFWPVVAFVVANASSVVNRLIAETRAKGLIRNMFGTYVAPTVVDRMIESGEQPQLGGEECEITAFFSDIQGFSSFSEQLPPKELVELMCEYLTEMTDILQFHGGTLDKYIGDAIVGMFGAPLHFDKHSTSGCAAAIEVQLRQAELAKRWRTDDRWPESVSRMRTRIGLNTGMAVVGNIGSRSRDGGSQRFNYTMIGDTVNLAARCESGGKAYGVYTMVTEATRKQAVDRPGERAIAFRELDRIVVQGREQPETMHEVVGYLDDLDQRSQDCLEHYQKGMQAYLALDWEAAIRAFEAAQPFEQFQPGSEPGIKTNPSRVLLERSRFLKEDPPGDDWDGVYVMKSK